MDLIDDPAPGENAHEFTVSEISGAVRRVVEGEFGRVRVKGEVGRVFPARSGHLYFDLKDDRSVIAAVSWKGQVARLTVRPEEGMEVVATGKLTTFPSQSKYQLTVEDIRPAGVGALMAMLEKRKKMLAAEGLFAAERKKPIPFLPEVIGVVTSPSGAVIRDILHRLADRFPRRVIVWPVAVQGDACAPQVAAAIRGFNAMDANGPAPRPDLLIVARGGGSIEDLWGFNEEAVARAAAESDIPLISAVGHETDTTLIDFVSDARAPTPTAAAEMAVPVRRDLVARVAESQARLVNALSGRMTQASQRLRDLARALPSPVQITGAARQRLDAADRALPAALRGAVRQHRVLLAERGNLRHGALTQQISQARTRLDDRAARLDRAFKRGQADTQRRQKDRILSLSDRLARSAALTTQGRKTDLEGLSRMLETLSYQATLSRGYAVVRGDGEVVTTTKAAKSAQDIEIEFSDGRFAPNARSPKKSKPGPPEQGSLF